MPVKQHQTQGRQDNHSFRNLVLHHLHLAGIGHRIVDSYRQLSRAARRLLFADAAFVFYAYLAGIFVNVYLWKQSGGFLVPAAYTLSIYLVQIFVFWAVALSPFRLKAKRLMQVGLAISAIRYLMLLLAGAAEPITAALVGAIGGLAGGLYWTGDHALLYSKTTNENRDQFYGLSTSVGYVSSIIAPALGGLLIAKQNLWPWLRFGHGGYHLLFLAMVLTLLITAVLAERLDGLRIARGRISQMKSVIRIKRWRFMLMREFLDGIMTGPVNFIGVVLAFTILGNSELSLGVFSSVFALLGAIASLLIGGLIAHRDQGRIKLGYIGAALYAFSTIIYIGLFNFTGMVISSFIDIFAGPLFAIGMAATLYHAIDKSLKSQGNFFAFIVMRETMLTAGRVGSIALFILTLGWGADLTVAKMWFLVLFLIPFGFCLLTTLANRAGMADERDRPEPT